MTAPRKPNKNGVPEQTGTQFFDLALPAGAAPYSAARMMPPPAT